MKPEKVKNLNMETTKEISEFIKHHTNYGYYKDYACGAIPRCGNSAAMELEAEHLRRLNCEDERITKMRETKNNISSILRTSKETLKDSEFSEQGKISQYMGEVYSNAYKNIFNALKEAEPDVPDRTIHYIIDNFLQIEFKKEYDVKTREYSLIVNATWKSPEEIASEVKEALE